MDHTTPLAQAPAAPSASLTIGDLARQTGVSTAVLRMWETRHGFPTAVRLPSGHRRYTEDTVRLVERVVRRRDSGIRLEMAMAEVTASLAPTSPSIFAELRRRHPTLPTHRLRKSTLIAISHAIEDECCAVAEHPVLFGAFQEARFFTPARPRWHELARVAQSAIVFADEWPTDLSAAEGPIRVALAADAPMRREWAVVCDAADSSACLTAWEIPGQEGIADRDRFFESTWTVEPAAVRDAARTAAAVADNAGAVLGEDLTDHLAQAPLADPLTTTRATALFNRVVAYVDRYGA